MIILSELLKSKPVALIWGSYTCAVWQGLHMEGSSYVYEYRTVEKYKDNITFVHMVF